MQTRDVHLNSSTMLAYLLYRCILLNLEANASNNLAKYIEKVK